MLYACINYKFVMNNDPANKFIIDDFDEKDSSFNSNIPILILNPNEYTV